MTQDRQCVGAVARRRQIPPSGRLFALQGTCRDEAGDQPFRLCATRRERERSRGRGAVAPRRPLHAQASFAPADAGEIVSDRARLRLGRRQDLWLCGAPRRVPGPRLKGDVDMRLVLVRCHVQEIRRARAARPRAPRADRGSHPARGGGLDPRRARSSQPAPSRARTPPARPTRADRRRRDPPGRRGATTRWAQLASPPSMSARCPFRRDGR